MGGIVGCVISNILSVIVHMSSGIGGAVAGGAGSSIIDQICMAILGFSI